MTKITHQKPIISLIAAIAKDGGIGKDNKLLFNIPEDLKYFHKVTKNHTVIMGYNTYNSIGKALPERRNIVLSRREIELPDATVCKSLDEAVQEADSENEIFIIGGASVYEQSIKFADKLYLTLVDAVVPADTFFPDYSEFDSVKVLGEGESGELSYKFLELTRS